MNIKKQIGHERCNGVSGVLLFDSTNAIIENCLYSSGCSIANVSGNSKCESNNILTELYHDEYVSPTDKENKSGERYYRIVNCIQHYFMLWKNSNCEYITKESNKIKDNIITYTYNIENNSYVNDKSTWVFVEKIAKDYWINTDNKVSTIYQEYIAETGSITDFPKCNPKKVFVDKVFNVERPTLIITGKNLNNDDENLYLKSNENYTSCIQMLKQDVNKYDTTDADDLKNSFIVWSSFLYTDGNEMKWSKFPNVIYNVDFEIQINSINYTSILNTINNYMSRNLGGHTLIINLMENLTISNNENPVLISDFYNGEVIFNGGGHTITYENTCGILFSNIQFLTIKKLNVINDTTNKNDIKYDDEYKFNVCLKCIDIDNLTLSDCNVENIMIHTFDSVFSSLDTQNSIYNNMSINASYLDNIKKSTINKTVGMFLVNCKGIISNCNFTDPTIGLCIDQNSNICIKKQSLNDYCIFKHTQSNKNSIYKSLGCIRIPMILFYITGNSKISTNISIDSPIKYNETGTDKLIIKCTEFVKNENFILEICDPGSLFDHTHDNYSLMDTLKKKNNYNVVNYGDFTDYITTDITRVTIFANSHGGHINNYNGNNNNLIELKDVAFSSSNVTQSILDDWYWFSTINDRDKKTIYTIGAGDSNKFFPIVLNDGILYNDNGDYGYKLSMIINKNECIYNSGLEKDDFAI